MENPLGIDVGLIPEFKSKKENNKLLYRTTIKLCNYKQINIKHSFLHILEHVSILFLSSVTHKTEQKTS